MTPEHRASLRKHERTKKLLDRLVRKWVGKLWLAQWKVDVTFHWNGLQPQEVHGRCECDWRYCEAMLHFNIPALSAQSDEQVERTVVHELLHIHLNEMRETGLPHEERVCSQLTNVIHHLARNQ